MADTNDHLVLISGESGTGKSASLKDLPDHAKVMYLNCESGKRLPFRNQFQNFTIVDPLQVLEAFDHAQNNPDIDVIVVDTLTFLLEMYESQYVIPAADSRAAWGEFAQFFKTLMQEKVAKSDKAVIFLAHTLSVYDNQAMEMKVQVPVKGALKNNGIEAYFSTVVSTKKMPLTELEDCDPDLLHVTEDDKLVGYKYVFQTRLTKQTTGERIRSPMGMFNPNQTYMDNNAALLLSHLHAYYS